MLGRDSLGPRKMEAEKKEINDQLPGEGGGGVNGGASVLKFLGLRGRL